MSPTISDFDNCAWEEAIDSAYAKDCSAYFQSFKDKINEAHEASDEQAQNAFTVLYAATSLHLNDPTNNSNPFCPILTGPGVRFPDLDDFTDNHIEVFGQLIPRIDDPELRARIADIVWVRKRGHQVAAQAVSAYLASARRLEDTRVLWPPCINRIKRAVTVAVRHGRNTQMFKQVISHIEDTLDRHKDNDPSYLSADLMEILLEQKEGNSTKHAQLSEYHAVSAKEDQDWYRPKTYWELQARWLERAKDDAGSKAARIREAEQYEHGARDLVNRARPDYLTAAELLKDAIQAFKRVGGQQGRVEKLHRELLEYQRRGTGQMGRVSAETPIDDLRASAINAVTKKPRSEAIRALALIDDPSYLGFLRQYLQQEMEEFPLLHILPWIQQDASGRTTDFAPSSLSDSSKDREASARSHLLRNASQMRSLMVQASIEPARLQILQEHSVCVQDFAPFVANNPFVPEGRETAYTRGLHAGLEGDFLVATQLLIPQLENSVRYVLEHRGAITSGLKSKGIQDVDLLGTLLRRPEVEEVFGEDITFDLQGLLTERFGDNLRNRVAHGLMNDEDFLRTDAIYLWWLSLHLLVRFQIARESQTDQR